MLSRRQLLVSALAALLPLAAASRRKILLRSSWQVVNIGDIAHTPGVLALIEQHLPQVDTALWASTSISEPVQAMLRRRFPKLRIVTGSITSDGKASNPELADEISSADFLLHGSGPSLVAAKDVAAFHLHTGKPFGIYGITISPQLSELDRDLITRSRFAFFRDSVSLAQARKQVPAAPLLEFAPDGAFACDLRDDTRAETFLKANALEPQKFLCCLSRLRHTPYWLIKPGTKVDETKVARNAAMKEHDHRALRDAIITAIRQTDLKVLLCPEDASQMAVGKELFFDHLPDDVKPRVVWRDAFWLTDEALSVYTRSAGLFGSEMHSPIMAIGNGIPAIVCRFEEQTSKGFMWRDIGLGHWLFDLDQPADHDRIVPAVLDLAQNPVKAREQVKQAQSRLAHLQAETLQALGKHIG